MRAGLFFITYARCALIVISCRPRLVAICLFIDPAITWPITSRSRGVNDASTCFIFRFLKRPVDCKGYKKGADIRA